MDQKNLDIVLSRGDRFIHVIVNGLKKSIPKSDIASINQYFEYDEDRWIPVFTEITFQNGNVLNLTDLIISQYAVRDKFYFEQHLFQEHNVNKIALRKRTDLSLYFPEH